MRELNVGGKAHESRSGELELGSLHRDVGRMEGTLTEVGGAADSLRCVSCVTSWRTRRFPPLLAGATGGTPRLAVLRPPPFLTPRELAAEARGARWCPWLLRPR